MIKPIYKALIYLTLMISPVAYAGDSILVISNLAHKSQTIDKDMIKQIFLGTRTMIDTWRLTPLNQEASSKIRNDFYKIIANKDPIEMKIYWSEQIFSGKARLPKELTSDLAVIQEVSNNQNAIGYVNSSADTSKINVITKLSE